MRTTLTHLSILFAVAIYALGCSDSSATTDTIAPSVRNTEPIVAAKPTRDTSVNAPSLQDDKSVGIETQKRSDPGPNTKSDSSKTPAAEEEHTVESAPSNDVVNESTPFDHLTEPERFHLALLASCNPPDLTIHFIETGSTSLSGALLRSSGRKLNVDVNKVTFDDQLLTIGIRFLSRNLEWNFGSIKKVGKVDFVAGKGWDEGCELELHDKLKFESDGGDVIVLLAVVDNTLQRGDIKLRIKNAETLIGLLRNKAFTEICRLTPDQMSVFGAMLSKPE